MTVRNISRYNLPAPWMRYDMAAIITPLVEAKTAAGMLGEMPHLRQWIEQVHEEQLRLEAVGTSRIEGAEFTEQEQEQALSRVHEPDLTVDGPRSPLAHVGPLTRSQRQLRAADATYRWLRGQPADRPVTDEFILEIHRRIVTGCDDDHCEPGALRPPGSNVTFGSPRCRGVEGGEDCRLAFRNFCDAIAGEFRQHDAILQALASHYQIGAMHPFEDGNGRTARALEAFMLRRAGVNDLVMVSLSNYYYEHQDEYRASLQECRQREHDLTPFMQFALGAVADRCKAVAEVITYNQRQILFRQFARSLFGQLRSSRRRVIGERQLHILDALMDGGPARLFDLIDHPPSYYSGLRFPERAVVRDLLGLMHLQAISVRGDEIVVNLDWPQQFSESVLLDQMERMPTAASASHPAMAELSELLRRRR